jgi:hypothetical protein
MVDKFGSSIQASMFNDKIDRWGSLIKEGATFMISRAVVEPSNPRFIFVDNPYCLTLEDCSRIVPVENDDSLPIVKAKEFSNLIDISQMQTNTHCNFIGVVTQCLAIRRISDLK